MYEESNSFINDIAILKLCWPLTLNKQVQPACLPSKTWFPKEGTEDCYVSGWGALAVDPYGPIPYAEQLQWLKQNIIANEKCQNLWDSIIDVKTKTKCTNTPVTYCELFVITPMLKISQLEFDIS